jgi:hypothetical protein
MYTKKCNDCKFFANRDVFKGFCLTNQKDAIIDTDAIECASYVQADKCRFCNSYKSGAGPEYSKGALGECGVQSVMVYADLGACPSFDASKAN